eukprot:m.101097 g.101097  ORF g.101097 m.101097 type:complete len:153 (-) comp16792_c0_seq1:394-852(-)
MPKYYCDYCDTYLTHDSSSVRKTHNSGRKHKDNVRAYYEKWVDENIPGGMVALVPQAQMGNVPSMMSGGVFRGPAPPLNIPNGLMPTPGSGMNMGSRPPMLPPPGMGGPRGMPMLPPPNMMPPPPMGMRPPGPPPNGNAPPSSSGNNGPPGM